MYIHKITFNHTTYPFTLYNNLHPDNIYFESPITGELIEVKPPFSLSKYTIILTNHIKNNI